MPLIISRDGPGPVYGSSYAEVNRPGTNALIQEIEGQTDRSMASHNFEELLQAALDMPNRLSTDQFVRRINFLRTLLAAYLIVDETDYEVDVEVDVEEEKLKREQDKALQKMAALKQENEQMAIKRREHRAMARESKKTNRKIRLPKKNVRR